MFLVSGLFLSHPLFMFVQSFFGLSFFELSLVVLNECLPLGSRGNQLGRWCHYGWYGGGWGRGRRLCQCWRWLRCQCWHPSLPGSSKVRDSLVVSFALVLVVMHPAIRTAVVLVLLLKLAPCLPVVVVVKVLVGDRVLFVRVARSKH